MNHRKFFSLLILLHPLFAICQQITYSEFTNEIFLGRNIEVVGKIEDNILVRKILGNKYQLLILNDELKLKATVNLDFIPPETYRVNFIPYPNSCMMVFQSAVNDILYSKIASVNKDGQLTGKIIAIDSAKLVSRKNNLLYNITYSDNKKYLLFSRRFIDSKQDQIRIEQIIINDNAELIKAEEYSIDFSPNLVISDLKIDDNANVVFITYPGILNTTTNLAFYKLPSNSNDLVVKNISVNKYELREPTIRINNKNSLYHLISFYQNSKSKDVEGLFSMVLNPDLSDHIRPFSYSFPDSLKKVADRINIPKKAFNNYFLKDIFFREDGSLIITATMQEKISSHVYSDNQPINDMRTSVSPMASYRVRNSTNYTYADQLTETFRRIEWNANRSIRQSINYRDYTETTNTEGNVVIFSVDKFNHVANAASLSRNSTRTPLLPYYQVMNFGDRLFFIYNEIFKHKKILLNSLNLQADGNLIANPLFRDLDKGYTFIPSLGKQLDMKSMIVPCEKNNKPALAMIHFDQPY